MAKLRPVESGGTTRPSVFEEATHQAPVRPGRNLLGSQSADQSLGYWGASGAAQRSATQLQGRGGATIGPERIRGNRPLRDGARRVAEARRTLTSNGRLDPNKFAEALQKLATSRKPFTNATRVSHVKALFAGLSAAQVKEVRAAYVRRYGIDPEHHLRSDDLLQPLLPLPRAVETELVGALNSASLTEAARALSQLLAKANRGQLTADDRRAFFSMMPMIGLWKRPVRAEPGDDSRDAMERTLLRRAFEAQGTGVGLDEALKTIQDRMPVAQLAYPKGPSQSVALLCSEDGAHWEELVGQVLELQKQNVHVQIFTPNGAPVAFQRDSLGVFNRPLRGFGTPPEYDPAGPTGEVMKRLLENTAAAEQYDASKFDGLAVIGGLGFNDGVARADPIGDPRDQRVGFVAHPQAARMVREGFAPGKTISFICHAATILPAVSGPDGKPLSEGLEVATLPRVLEGIAGWTGRKEGRTFPYNVPTHAGLERGGAIVDQARDLRQVLTAGLLERGKTPPPNPKLVVHSGKRETLVVSSAGPAGAKSLGAAMARALQERAP